MAQITLEGNPLNTNGELPAVGSSAPDFSLLNNELARVSLESFAGKRKVVSIFPSVDTPVCATSVKKFNEVAGSLDNTVVLNVSADLPFAQNRFCGAEGIKNVSTFSTFGSSFTKDWNVEIVDGPLAGLCCRAIVILDENNTVIYNELVPEIAQEPNYDNALAALNG